MNTLVRIFTLISLGFIVLFAPAIPKASAKLKDLKFSGYITQVNSPTSFLVDDYRITVDNVKDIELDHFDSKSIKFDPAEQIKVGTYIKFKGKYDTETLEATVSEIKIDMRQFQRFAQTVVLDNTPASITKNADGSWSGVIVADARKIQITPSTKVTFKLNKSEEKEAKKEAKEAKKLTKKEEEGGYAGIDETPDKIDTEKTDQQIGADDTHEDVESKKPDEGFQEEGDMDNLLKGSTPLKSFADVGPGIYMTYRGKEDLSGTVVADQVVFVKNEMTKDERKMWKGLRLKQKDARKANSLSDLKVGNDKYKVLPDMEVQEYISRLGESLIPEYQKNLSDDDENKIQFLFKVVYEKAPNASAYPTGTVIVHHDVFNYLEDEAQLVFLLSHEISHTTQEHILREQNDKKNTRTALKIGGLFAGAMGYGGIGNILRLTELAMKNGYKREMENQADRLGVSSMIAHGYDPREAPRLWKLFSLYRFDGPKNFFTSDHDTNTERRSFLWLTIHNTYANVDFASLKKDSEEFHRIADVVAAKYPVKHKRVIAE